MKNRIFLLLWLGQCFLGTLFATCFLVLAFSGYDIRQYITTFVVSIVFLVTGIIGIVKWVKNK